MTNRPANIYFRPPDGALESALAESLNPVFHSVVHNLLQLWKVLSGVLESVSIRIAPNLRLNLSRILRQQQLFYVSPHVFQDQSLMQYS